MRLLSAFAVATVAVSMLLAPNLASASPSNAVVHQGTEQHLQRRFFTSEQEKQRKKEYRDAKDAYKQRGEMTPEAKKEVKDDLDLKKHWVDPNFLRKAKLHYSKKLAEDSKKSGKSPNAFSKFFAYSDDELNKINGMVQKGDEFKPSILNPARYAYKALGAAKVIPGKPTATTAA
ncbi:hypothetical protein IWQ60_000832 [Tieghemiomyces parasiticus]|uniref:RxLR effector protein n=1 Tax=Tieghemiomyces parasiticus TaxID=78921 RepID=A0A9W8AKD2_9FUNG|nr:hypothetical protein IWQ60_000832 [Tieghemiomyces parasiticus]